MFITDRMGLCDTERTNPYRIRKWRKDNWISFEGKEIKNSRQLDFIDKTRKKLADQTQKPIKIQWMPRKKNREADRLAKKGKKRGLRNESLVNWSEKIGRRKYDGGDVNYGQLKQKQEIQIHIYRKESIRNQWEISAELCTGDTKGNKIKIVTDSLLEKKLKRRNEYIVKIKKVFTHHVCIFRSLKKIKKAESL